ncbi:hypothetical protein BOVMAS03_07150 [Streptococcus uberis]
MHKEGFGEDPDDGVGEGVKGPVGFAWEEDVMKKNEKVIKSDQIGK